MREQVEVLEHHADLAADLVDALQVIGEFDAVDDDMARLVLLEPVDAADERRLARARRPAHDDALALVDGEVDVLQHMKVAEPLVHVADLNGDFVGDGERLGRPVRHLVAFQGLVEVGRGGRLTGRLGRLAAAAAGGLGRPLVFLAHGLPHLGRRRFLPGLVLGWCLRHDRLSHLTVPVAGMEAFSMNME
jgi:hypothetical protein